MSKFYDDLEIREPERRQRELIAAVSSQVRYAREHTSAYATMFADMDTENIDTPEAIARLPLTRKSALLELQQRERPFGGFSPLSGPDLAYIFASPGPIYEPGSRRVNFWRLARAMYAAGLRRGDLIHNCFSYHLTPAGAMMDSGALALGCTVIPAGVGQTELQVSTIRDLRPRGYTGTPSFLKIILEKADEMDIDVTSIECALVSGEALPPPLRKDFDTRGVNVLQCYATADLGVIAYESDSRAGLIVDEGVYLEIVRPGTGDPVADGEVGEVVVTSLNPDYPLIRFATGDLSAILSGSSPCGRTNRRIKGWMGRADQTAKVRGMFVHPSQVSELVQRFPEITRARLVVDWVDQQDRITLKCECLGRPIGLEEKIVDAIREVCKVRGEVELMDADSLPNDGRVIDDMRKYD